MTERFHIEDLVATFNEQITNYQAGQGLDPNLIQLRISQMKEEIDETLDAIAAEDFVGTADGLLDLIYFAIGTLHIMGVDREMMNACFMAIHLANMGKRGGIKEERRIPGLSDEEHPMDAYKPDGWIPPEFLLKVILDGRTSNT